MGLLNRGNDWLTRTMFRAGGVAVSYTRGAQTVPVAAVVGQTGDRSERTGGAWVVIGDRDYLITVADLAAFGVPQIGDRITHTIGGVAVVFEIEAPGTDPGALPWRHSDPDHLTWRITVKRVG